MKSMLFQRLALSKDKEGVLKLSQQGQVIDNPEDVLKDPYVFEFTGLPELPVYQESDLEDALIANLSQFLLELKGLHLCGQDSTAYQYRRQNFQGGISYFIIVF